MKKTVTLEKELYHSMLRNSIKAVMYEADVARLKAVITKMCMELVDPDDDMSNGLAEYFNQDLLLEIHEVLK